MRESDREAIGDAIQQVGFGLGAYLAKAPMLEG